MKDLAEAALNAAQVKGAGYADVRLDEHVQQDIVVKNGQLAAVSDDASEGFGVRVLVDGAWGFAGSARLNKNEIDEVVDRAIRIARASARVRSVPVDLGPPVTSRGRYRTPLERDPFSVPLSEKVDLLLRADAAMGAVKGVGIREGLTEFLRQRNGRALCGDQLLDDRQTESPPVRLAAGDDHRGCPHPHRPRHLRLGGRGRARPAIVPDQGRALRRLPHLP